MWPEEDREKIKKMAHSSADSELETTASTLAPSALPFGLSWRLIREFIGYGLSSGAGLALDYGLLVGLTELAHLPVGLSTAIGFCAGLVLVYFMSIRLVFKERTVSNAWAEFVTFCAIGLAGLAITEGLMLGLTLYVGIPYALAKIPTAGIVFLFNFVARKAMLFTKP